MNATIGDIIVGNYRLIIWVIWALILIRVFFRFKEKVEEKGHSPLFWVFAVYGGLALVNFLITFLAGFFWPNTVAWVMWILPVIPIMITFIIIVITAGFIADALEDPSGASWQLFAVIFSFMAGGILAQKIVLLIKG